MLGFMIVKQHQSCMGISNPQGMPCPPEPFLVHTKQLAAGKYFTDYLWF
jgi:hypothetical protein